MGLIDMMKKAGVDAVGATNPVNVLLGEILSTEDIKIKIDQKLILTKEFLIIPEGLTRYEIDLSHTHGISENVALNKLVIREGLKQGDKVLLLRVQGGQQYIVLDKVV